MEPLHHVPVDTHQTCWYLLSLYTMSLCGHGNIPSFAMRNFLKPCLYMVLTARRALLNLGGSVDGVCVVALEVRCVPGAW